MKKSNYIFGLLITFFLSANLSCGEYADFAKHEIDYGRPDSRYHPPEWIQGTWISPLSGSFIFIYTFLNDNILESQGDPFSWTEGNSEIISIDESGQRYYEIRNSISDEFSRFTFISNNQIRYSYKIRTLIDEYYLYKASSEEIE